MKGKIYSTHEQEIISGCLRQDRKAQRLCYDTYSPVMYVLCRRYVRDEMEAEDILVKSFTRIFLKIEQYRGDGSFEGWMKRIVIHEALSYLRSHRSKEAASDLDWAQHIPDDQAAGDPLEQEDLLRMIRQLPPGYQQVFNLYAIDGYSHQEIAEQLQISENTSKSQLSRARTFLQKLLSRQEITSYR